jgi:hypothetical protein
MSAACLPASRRCKHCADICRAPSKRVHAPLCQCPHGGGLVRNHPKLGLQGRVVPACRTGGLVETTPSSSPSCPHEDSPSSCMSFQMAPCPPGFIIGFRGRVNSHRPSSASTTGTSGCLQTHKIHKLKLGATPQLRVRYHQPLEICLTLPWLAPAMRVGHLVNAHGL